MSPTVSVTLASSLISPFESQDSWRTQRHVGAIIDCQTFRQGVMLFYNSNFFEDITYRIIYSTADDISSPYSPPKGPILQNGIYCCHNITTSGGLEFIGNSATEGVFMSDQNDHSGSGRYIPPFWRTVQIGVRAWPHKISIISVARRKQCLILDIKRHILTLPFLALREKG